MSNTMYTCMYVLSAYNCCTIKPEGVIIATSIDSLVLTCLMHSYAYILIYHLCTASLNCTLRLYMYSAFACLLVNKNFIHKIEPDAPSGVHSHLLLPGADKNLDHFYTGKVHVCC